LANSENKNDRTTVGKSAEVYKIARPSPIDFAGETAMTAAVELKANDKILFIGDSITDAERHRRAYEPLGCGYVHFVGYTLQARYPELNLQLVNTGVGGDTVKDMARRWQADCLAHRPDVLSVLVGINDVWRGTMEPNRQSSPAEEYEVTYDQLLLEARQQGVRRIILGEPFLFSRDTRNVVLSALQPYLNAVRSLAVKHQAVLVPLQQKLDNALARTPAEKWSDDSVHPARWAHAWIAQRWLDATGL
jgi:lysophospholipase L1-like esterase